MTDGTVKLYPNPAKNILNIKIVSNNNSNSKLVITDASGKTIFVKLELISSGESIIQLNTSNLSSGVYYVEFIDTNSNTKKIVNKFVKE